MTGSSELPDVSIAALRRLAQGLLYDRHGAEDVVQEAWLAALRARPDVPRLGAWLTGAVRRLALNRRREEARRATRELAAAREEALPDASDGTAHIEVLRALLDALDTLEEPYRTAVMMRYLEERPPREIARRLGVPVNTARTHVRRGVERLRRQLDGERGQGRQGLLAALAPLAGGMPWTVAVGAPGGGAGLSKWSGVLLVNKKLALVALVLVLGLSWMVLRTHPPGEGRDGSAESSLVLAESTATESSGSDRDAALELGQRPAERELAVAPPPLGTWIVRGHAFDARGQSYGALPLVGRVYAGPKAQGEPLLERRFATDAQGDFAWPLDPPSELVLVEVEAVLAGAFTMPTSDVFLPGDPPPECWILRAAPLDCTIHGIVRGPRGEPVAGARVREQDRTEPQETTTGADGRYALRIVEDNDFRLRVCASGFAQESVTLDASSGDVEAPEVSLRPEHRMRGRVVDEQGRPIEGATVAPGSPWDMVSTTSDAAGAFELGTLDLDAKYLSLEARKDGYVAGSINVEREARKSTVELRLVRGLRITGRVVGPDQKPVWGAWISVGQWMWGGIDGYSDRDGRFVLEHVPSGLQRFWTWRTGLAQKVREIELPADAAEFEVELVLEEEHHVGGIVIDERDAPLPWVMVYAQAPNDGSGTESFDGIRSYAGPDGRFRLDGFPELPRISVGALTSGRARVEQEVAGLDRDDVVLRMARSAGLAGRVVDAASGAPLPSFVVRVGPAPPGFAVEGIDGYPALWSRGVAFTSPEGEWRLEYSMDADRAASITIEADGYAPAMLVVRTAVDPDPNAAVVRLAHGTVVRGRVVEKENGAPVEGARIRRCTPNLPLESLDNADEGVFETSSDASGRFEFVNVPTGTMSLAVEHDGWAVSVSEPFEVDGAAPVERWIELVHGARVRGRLLDEAGEPIAGESVSLSGLEGIERSREHVATTDAQGRYELAGLAAGLYHLRWARKRGEIGIYDLLQLVELKGEESLELDLQPRGRATLEGTLEYDGELAPVVGVMLLPRSAQRPDGTYSHWALRGRAAFAESGRFTVTGLEPGEYNVIVYMTIAMNGFARGSASVDVPNEGRADVHLVLEREKR